MEEGQSGIMSWVTSIRATLANDPARQAFEDQIHRHGFLFLEDYLENILRGPRREPIIELVKTPSRKKDAPQRTRAAAGAAAKAKSHISAMPEGRLSDKENFVPVNKFQQALLDAKEDPSGDDDIHPPPSLHLGQRVLSSSTCTPDYVLTGLDDTLAIIDVADSVPPTPNPEKDPGTIIYDVESSPIRSLEQLSRPTTVSEVYLNTIPEPHKELSIIAEDDEAAERSRLSAAIMGERISSASGQPRLPRTSRLDSENANDSAVAPNDQEDTIEQTHNGSVPSHQQDAVSHSSVPEKSLSAADTDAPPSSLPSLPKSDIVMVPLRDETTSPKTLNRKGSIPQFPSLPAPSPLRKSMRAPREPSVGAGLLPSMTPMAAAPGLGGNRTSWLVKAREANAIEVPVKRVQTPKETPQLSSHGSSSSSKRKSDDMAHPPPFDNGLHSSADNAERRVKMAKLAEDGQSKGAQDEELKHGFRMDSPSIAALHYTDAAAEGDTFYFKRKVEELGRGGKSLSGKSLGGPAAVAALAEARKAAEAKVAERNKIQNPSVPPEPETKTIQHSEPQPRPDPHPAVTRNSFAASSGEARLSVSDLVGVNERKYDLVESAPSILPLTMKVFSAPTLALGPSHNDSTTPPNSPPSQISHNPIIPTKAISKPPVIFVPPDKGSADRRADDEISTQIAPKAMSINPFTLPPSFTLAGPATLRPSQSDERTGLSAQSSAVSLCSEPVFDSQPSWLGPSQETDATGITSQFDRSLQEDPAFIEEDEEERYEKDFAKNNPTWTPFGFANADDSVTWTTDHTESQKGGDTGPISDHMNAKPIRQGSPELEDDFDGAGDQSVVQDDLDMDLEEEDDDDLPGSTGTDDAHAQPKLSNMSKANSDKLMTRSESQLSMASSSASSSQASQMGFFGQAARFVSNALGNSKKKVEPVKSLQLAAAAAKKQAEEQERKTARLKEMETRRQQATQRKVEEEKTRVIEEERKAKEDAERRKREREEHTDKRPLKTLAKKVDDDAANKKRKVNPEADKKPESKKPPSKEKKDPVPRAPQTALPSHSKTNVKSVATPHAPRPTAGPSSAKPPVSANAKASTFNKDKGKAKAPEEAFRAKTPIRTPGQMPPPKHPQPRPAVAEPVVPSESIELPDIDSEYSDSDDETRKRNFDPPHWAQSPALRQALQEQSTVNPDHIFGAMRPLHMEEIFRSRQSRFRARTSSANWTGADRLTLEEQLNYARRMGYDQ